MRGMNGDCNHLWTIEELGAQAALALSVDYAGQGSGRVREVPDQRTIRYYTTLGLLDRPAAMRGRTALYGRRHLLQLVAIKRLQARGIPLAELQRQLLGLTDSELARVAKLPPVVDHVGVGALPEPRSKAFWMEPPAPVDKRDPPPTTSRLPLQGVVLGDGLTLLINPARALESDDLEAIRVAAAPLQKLLELRQLI
jgi:DNA-binding transcriptional MerR regulator